jgi:hypothetical protein
MISFEYQGEQHYGHTTFEREDLTRIQHRDNFKAEEAKRLGITLIDVPYWWDGSSSQLAATIRLKRPDLLAQYENASTPIPSHATHIRHGTFCNNLLLIQIVAMEEVPNEYTLLPGNGRPRCRGCNDLIVPGQLRIVVKANNPKLSRPYKVQVSFR